MDLNSIAASFVVLITPFLPYLTSGLQESTKEVGKLFGSATFDRVQKSWNKVTAISKKDKKFQNNIEILVEQPGDTNVRSALSAIIANQLAKDPILLSEIAALMQEELIQEILITDSEAEDVSQRMNRSGRQSVTISNSNIGDVSQNQ